MGRMKDLFTTVEEHLRAGEFAEAVELLEPWGNDIPNQLWGVILAISGNQGDILPSHYLPRPIRNKWLSLVELQQVCRDLEEQEITGMNVALILDMVEERAHNA